MSDLPETWIQVSLGEVTEPIEKVLPAKDPEKEIRYLDISGIDNSSNRITEAKTYIGADAPSRARQLVREGDVLFSTVRTYLKNIARVPSEYDGQIASTGFSVLRPSIVILSEYLFAYSLTPMLLEPLAALQRGSSYPAVREQDVRTQIIPLPPLAEQKRIVSKIEELFSELDAGEESLRQARRQLGVYRQSLLKQAFEGKLTAPWRKQNPHLLESTDKLLKRIQEERQAGYEEQIKEWESLEKSGRKPGKPKEFEFITPEETNQLSDLPHGWLWVRFGNVLSIRSGDGLTASQMDGGQFPVYGGNGVSGFHGSYMFEEPKLVIGRVGAKCGITHITAPKSWVTDNALICEFQIQSADMMFMRLLLNHLDLNKLSVSTAQPVVSGSKLNPLPVPLCSLPEQREIVRLLDEQFTVIEQNEREIDAALKRSAALRQSILKKAFTGHLVPQDPTDEPASALLERIRKEREEAAGTGKLPKIER